MPCARCGGPRTGTALLCYRCLYATREPYARTCTECGKTWTSKATGRRCEACKLKARRHPCPGCGTLIDYRASYCHRCHPVERMTVAQAIERYLAKAEPWGDCLLAAGGTGSDGYPNKRGPYADRDVQIRPARLIAERELGRELGERETVDHLCHNADPSCPGGPICRHRRCINPDHLGVTDRVTNWRRADTWTRRRKH